MCQRELARDTMIGAVLPDLSCFDRPEMIKMVKNRLSVRVGDIARLAVDELAKCRSGTINVLGITTVGKRPDEGTARTHLSRKLTEKPKQIGYMLINMGPKDKAHPCARNCLRQGDVREHIIDLNHPICAPQRAASVKASQLVCGADIGVAHIPIRSGQEGATKWSDFDPKLCRANTARDKIEESGIPLIKLPGRPPTGSVACLFLPALRSTDSAKSGLSREFPARVSRFRARCAALVKDLGTVYTPPVASYWGPTQPTHAAFGRSRRWGPHPARR
tara:strand:+ start:674 stop:1501 length:828 start_codon:yes stop_codon:yes gene_type:complete